MVSAGSPVVHCADTAANSTDLTKGICSQRFVSQGSLLRAGELLSAQQHHSILYVCFCGGRLDKGSWRGPPPYPLAADEVALQV